MAVVILGVTACFLSTGIAEATSLTSPTGTVATPTIKAEAEGHVVLDNPITKIECASTVTGSITVHGNGKSASGPITSLSFTGCTEEWHVTVVLGGSLSVNGTTGTYNGDVLSTGATVETTRFGTTCRYSTNATTIGTLTGGTPATLDISASIPFHSGSVFCGSGATSWTGSFKVTSPSSLYVDPEVREPIPSTVTSPTGTVATPTIKAEAEGHVILDNPIAKIECASSGEGKVEGHGGGSPAGGLISTLAFTGCTDEWHVTVVSGGELTAEWASGYNGTVFSEGATVEATRFGITCRYKTEDTHIGTITGGEPATLHISGSIPKHSGSIFCGNNPTRWTGSYRVTSPSALYIDKEVVPGNTITSPTGTVATPTIKAESEGHVALDHPIAKIQCRWSFEGTVKSHEGEAAEVPLASLSTTGCTEEWHATTTVAGKLIITGTGGYNGTVTWSGGTVEMTRSGLTCRYKTENTDIGTLTGGSPATIDIEGKLPFHSGSPLCGEEAYSLTGSLKLTSPSSLYVDEAA